MRKKNFQEKLWQLQSKKGRKKLYKFISIFSASIVILNTTMLASLIFIIPSASAVILPPQPGTNPDLGQSCGIDIALVLDSSGSISGSNLTQMKDSFKGFVDSFLPGTPTQFSVTDFDTTATVIGTFTNDVTAIKNAIDVPVSLGATNWQDGLAKAESTFDPRPAAPNLIIFASDGNPNKYYNSEGQLSGPGNGFSQDALNAAITEANLIKAGGTRIISLGIGSSVDQSNLEDISSSDAYYNAENFSSLTATLQQITTELCGGTITVQKIIDADGNLETTEDQTPGIGWEFDIDEDIVTTGDNGQTVPKEVDNGSYNVSEPANTGYELIDAACTGASEYNGSLDGDTVYGIQVEDSDVVNCTFYNSPKDGTLTVYKQVNNTFGGDAIASDFTIEVVNGTPVSFLGDASGTPVTVPANASYGVSETGGPQGYAARYDGDCSGTMPLAGKKTCTVVNDQLDPHADEGMITVIKNVVIDNGGTAVAADFTLYVDDATVTSGVSNYYAPNDYVISESAVSGYAQTSIICRDGEAIVSETGSISLSAGQAITCTITNDDIQPKLTVVKQVVGGTAQISDFPLYVALGQNEPVSVTSGQSNGFAAGDYSVSETNQANYAAVFSENCPNGTVSLSVGDDKTCTIINTYIPVPTYSVHGIKWNDENSNGEMDCTEAACEPKLSGWTIFIDEDADKQLDEGETSAVTASGEELGWYWFSGLSAGTYQICEVPQNGWTQTYPAENSCHTVTLPNDTQQSVNSVVGPQYDFGNHQNEVQQCTGSGTYTLNSDFDKGSLINVNHTPSDQIQLTDQVNAFNFIWVAVSSKGTVVKINTDTGAIVGEYKTSPSSQGSGDPSRTTVDKDGSVWLSNRSDVYEGKGSIIHIGLLENGQCEDRNGNGTIETSAAQNDIRPWADATGARAVATAEDECIVHYVKVPTSSGTRHVSVNTDNDVWVAGYYTRNFDLVKGGKWNVPGSGTIIRSETSVGYGGYGGLIDKNGVIWSAANLLRWDTSLPLTGPNGGNWTGYDHSSYGLCIDSQGNVFNTEYGSNVYKHAPDGTLLATFTHGTGAAQGCVVDKNDDLWIAGSLSGNTVDHLKNDGTFVGSVPVGSGPTGVAVDANGKIWATNYYSGTVSRIDPALGAIGADSVTKIGAVDFTSVGLGGNPYNYSDMTGSTLSGKAQSGTWTVVHDGTIADYPWRDISWTATLNGGQLSVTVATSSDGLTFGAPQTITSGQSLASLTTRYLKIVVSFDRSEAGNSPVLNDLTATRECGQTPPPPPPPPVCTSNCGGGGGGSTPIWLLATSTPVVATSSVLGETLKPVLKLEKSVSEKSAYAGAKNVKYTLTVQNTGNTSAFDVKVVDTLPKGLTFTDGSTAKTWNIGELKAGEKKTTSYTVNISADVPAASYINTAELTASGLPGISAKATIKVQVPKVLGEKLPNTGFDFNELLLLLTITGCLFFVGRRQETSLK